jgi:hypothetical protein
MAATKSISTTEPRRRLTSPFIGGEELTRRKAEFLFPSRSRSIVESTTCGGVSGETRRKAKSKPKSEATEVAEITEA